ncbi:MAG: hypothetical protein VYB90_03785 [Actinomycetota bacterium]|nr:hypothetical protein [Mycolicibacterium aurantiacum]MEC9322931.1 hypothetical protein [Actinomycetota bacterium]
MASLSMDSVTGAHARRWSLSALLRWLQAPVAAQSTPLVRDDTATAGPAKARRRHYPAQRDRVFEQAAMAREMYRL